MFYLLFRFLKGDQEKDYQGFRSKEDMIKFIQEKKEDIRIERVVEATKEFKLNWTLRLDEIDGPRPQRRGRPKKKKRPGLCKNPDCGEKFELEDWQHSSLHWCPSCRQLPKYKNYDKRNGMKN